MFGIFGTTSAAAIGGRAAGTVITRMSLGKIGRDYIKQTFLPTYGQSLPFGVGYGSGTFFGFPGNYRQKVSNSRVSASFVLPYNRYGRFYRRRRYRRYGRYRRRYY